jgi:hypothetical protein
VTLLCGTIVSRNTHGTPANAAAGAGAPPSVRVAECEEPGERPHKRVRTRAVVAVPGG